ncbi:Fic family protein [Patescibacteria group bacterium]|nr:Fic family protein [Patescibacteria group bacterium]MBU1122993.1 Fic family protein [Patescibacteria group bacterium]MBU1911668.1 Fic family protein [Patescibacteria group bacterium]
MKELRKIDDLQAKLDTFRPFSKELLALWQERLRIDWTYNSNAIEGNTLTYGETAFFLRDGLTSEGKPLKDYIEAKNHAEAIDYLHEVVQLKHKLTESFIKELHGLLMRDIEHTVAKGADGKLIHKPFSAGKYKTRPNHVLTLSGTIHKYAEPIKVPDEMQELLTWLKNGAKNLHAVERASLFHYRFVSIHPFDDGNGRMARLLMSMLLMQAGYPPCIIRNSKRREYLQSLEHADDTESTNAFLTFIAGELIQTEETMLKAIEGKPLPPIPDEKLHRDARKELILKTVGDDTLAISQIADRVPLIKRPTLKKDISALVRARKLKKKGKGKGVTYKRFGP